MRRCAALAVVLCLAVASLAAQRGPAPLEAIALVNASVIERSHRRRAAGSHHRPARRPDRKRRSASAWRLRRDRHGPAGVRTIDLRNRYVVPGLIDAHVHIASLPQLRQALESGVTTVRSAGVSNFVDVGMRELVKQGIRRRARRGRRRLPRASGSGARVVPRLPGTGRPDERRYGCRRNSARGARQSVARRGLDQGARHRARRHARHRSAQAGLLARGAADPRHEAATKSIPVMAHAHGAEGADAAVQAPAFAASSTAPISATRRCS